MELTTANLSRLRAILLDCHGEIKEWMEDFPLHALSGNPLDQSIGTVLSQATNDRNSSRAFANLKAEYSDWEDALAAPAAEVERAIARGGLGRSRSRRLPAVAPGSHSTRSPHLPARESGLSELSTASGMST